VLAPIEDSRLRAEIADTLDALEADTRWSWRLGPDGVWDRIEPAPGKKPLSAQELLMTKATKRAKKSR
jgi:polyphosphate kinase